MGDELLGGPSSNVDLWADGVLLDPYPAFAELRAAGPVVWLERYDDVAAVGRFAEVAEVLADWRRFSSARGVGLDDTLNSYLGESIICSDPPVHETYRRNLTDLLSAEGLAAAVPSIRATARCFAERAAGTGSGAFDAVGDLCRPYSLTVVADLVGLPEDGRADYPRLAERAFNMFGPAGDRALDGFSAAAEIIGRSLNAAEPGGLVPGGHGERVCTAGMPGMLVSYTWPGIDTTVNALASAVLLFAEHPDQWEALRRDRSLIPGAVNEVLRFHSPIHYFTRHVTGDTELAGVALPAGTKVLVMYGSANRDERRFEQPDTFDIRRPGPGHVAFGRGIHLCVGLHLARLEAHALLDALADRVGAFELNGEPVWTLNHTLHGLGRLPVRAIPAG